MILRDTNEVLDVYEWENGKVGIITTGPTGSTPASYGIHGRQGHLLLHPPEPRAAGRKRQPMKIYDAREGGGFLYNPPPQPCKASDECHGPGTQQAPPPAINTIEAGARSAQPGAKKKSAKCAKGR